MGINLTILKNRFYHRLLYDRWVWIGKRFRVHGNDFFSYYNHLQEQVRVLEDCFERLSDETKDKLKERRQFLAQKVLSTDDNVRWCTIEKAKKGLDDIKTKNKYPDDRSFIEEIEDFIIREESRYKAYLT